MVWKDLLVDAHPGRLLVRLQITHEPLEIADHVLANLRDKRQTFLSNENEDLAAICLRDLPAGVTEPLQTVHQPRGRSGSVAHSLRDFRHGKGMIVLRKKAEEEVLRERYVPAGELFGKMQDKAALHDREDVRELLGIRAQWRVIT